MAKKLALDISIDLLKLILPELLITHFDITNHEVENGVLHFYFEEKKESPKEENERILIAHGFHKEIAIQDFPLRGKNVYLHIKRRRWLDETTKRVAQRDWNLVAQGTRMTIEFAAFLKVLSQYQS
nr:transposase [Changchengzhania lutea]